MINENAQKKLLDVLAAGPHGVIEMSRNIPNFVETSTNFASVKPEGDHFMITTIQRSSVQTALVAVVEMVSSVFRLAGTDMDHADGYPGWNPNPDSEILEVARQSYQRLYIDEPKVLAVHDGHECGLIGEKYPEWILN